MKSLKAALTLLFLGAFGCPTPSALAAPVSQSPFIRQAYAKQRVTPLVTVPDGKITVDGDLSDWGDMTDHGAVIDDALDHTFGTLNGDTRALAVFKIAHDSSNLYIGVEVVDPSINPVPPPYYLGDSIQLYLDFRPVANKSGHSLGDADFDDGAYAIDFTAPTVDGVVNMQPDWHPANPPLGPITYVGRRTATGYNLEIGVPISSVPGLTQSRLADPVGIDIGIDDIDKTADGSTTDRRCFTFAGDPGQYQDAGSLGIADPSYKPVVPATTLRLVPASVSHDDDAALTATDGRSIVCGEVTRIGTVDPAIRTDLVGLDSSGRRTHFNLQDEHSESTDYPALGITIHRRWWPATRLKSGTYSLVTTYASGPARLATSFEVVAPVSHAAVAGKPFPPGSTAPDKTENGAYILPNGVRISPAGRHIPLPGDMPQSFVWIDRSHLAVSTGGYHDEGVDVIDVAANKVVQSLPVYQTFGSMAMDLNVLLVPGGHAVKKTDQSTFKTTFEHAIHQFTWDGSKLTAGQDIALAPKLQGDSYVPLMDSDMFVAGIAGLEMPYVVNINADKIYSLMGSPEGGFSLNSYTGTGYRPYAVAVAPDAESVAVANWGDETVNTYDPQGLAEIRSYKVASHPVALAYSPIHKPGPPTGILPEKLLPGGGRLFVACSGSNSVSVIDGDRVEETIKTSLDPDDIVGSTPDALAVSPDGKRLYVANADNNDICVVDISEPGESRVAGFIPTGWYPSAITVSPDGKKLYVGIGKGLGFAANPDGKYIANILSGAVSVVEVPSPARLAAYTSQVAANNAPAVKHVAVASTARFGGGIHHIVYIIRENRTYDQVLGDDPRGNGDPSITMFGSDVTPNVHQLVKDYVLLDNLYCSGEVSENGHQWCDSAYATDFIQRAWPQSYSGKDQPDADDRLTASPAGYLWDNCARHGLSYYSYGEFSEFRSSPDAPPVYTGEGTLRGHCSRGYGASVWNKRDPECAKYFIHDLHLAEKSGQWPNFMIMALPEDHTHGLGPDSYTPPACVASNDQAVGQIVQAVSHSRFWKDTAFFIIEDDAQDGPDHVDAHRTVGLVISPYIRRGYIDHTLYTTASYVRTIEDILGLPPMTQFDKNATPMDACFQSAPVMTAYEAVPPRIDLMAKNLSGPAAIESALLDFRAPDRVDPATYNRLLWNVLKPGIPMPPPVRRGLIASK